MNREYQRVLKRDHDNTLYVFWHGDRYMLRHSERLAGCVGQVVNVHDKAWQAGTLGMVVELYDKAGEYVGMAQAEMEVSA